MVIDHPESQSITDADQLVAIVGKRVREARKLRKLSRRVLSEQSGVSQRYLALLESGGGNISIALLFKVASALNYPLEWFFGGPQSSLQQQFDAADAHTRQQVLSLLQTGTDGSQKKQRVCFIGLRGAGKSTIGLAVSESLNMPFLELNKEIEDQSGLSVPEVMDLYGLDGYRRLERQAIEKIIQHRDSVIVAAAGGVVSEAQTYQLLLSNFYTVWLKALPQEHMQRVIEQGDQRPMAGNPQQAMADLKSILVDREGHYARADSMIDTSGKSIGDTTEETLLSLSQLGVG